MTKTPHNCSLRFLHYIINMNRMYEYALKKGTVMPWTWFIKWNTDYILFQDIFCCMLKMFTWTLCMREPHNIGPTNFESRTRVSFYIRLKPSTPKAAFPLARGLCDGRTDGRIPLVRRGVCRHILEASSPERHFVGGETFVHSLSSLSRSFVDESEEGRPFWNGPRVDAPSNPMWNRCGKVIV